MKDQEDFAIRQKIAARLSEERVLIEPHQGRFAKRVGVSQNAQSLIESGQRPMKAEYLAEVAIAGIDVFYVLTGERAELVGLGHGASELLAAYLEMPADMQAALRQVANAMRNQASRATVHVEPSTFRGEEKH